VRLGDFGPRTIEVQRATRQRKTGGSRSSGRCIEVPGDRFPPQEDPFASLAVSAVVPCANEIPVVMHDSPAPSPRTARHIFSARAGGARRRPPPRRSGRARRRRPSGRPRRARDRRGAGCDLAEVGPLAREEVRVLPGGGAQCLAGTEARLDELRELQVEPGAGQVARVARVAAGEHGDAGGAQPGDVPAPRRMRRRGGTNERRRRGIDRGRADRGHRDRRHEPQSRRRRRQGGAPRTRQAGRDASRHREQRDMADDEPLGRQPDLDLGHARAHRHLALDRRDGLQPLRPRRPLRGVSAASAALADRGADC
jgi:hypothetical protein